MKHSIPAAAVLLAGGQSRRMGQDKRMLSCALGGESLVAHAAEQVCWAAERYLSIGADCLSREGFISVPDIVPNCGPMGGIASCLRRTGLPWALVFPCDMPGLTAECLRALYERQSADADCILYSLAGKAMAFPVLLRVAAALPVLEKGLASGQLAFFRLMKDRLRVETLSAETLPFFAPDMLDNLNTPEDYARFCRRYEQAL